MSERSKPSQAPTASPSDDEFASAVHAMHVADELVGKAISAARRAAASYDDSRLMNAAWPEHFPLSNSQEGSTHDQAH
jgi:hypothetical protein